MILLSLLSSFAHALSNLPYYPAELDAKISQHLIKDIVLKEELYKLVAHNHVAVGYGPAKSILFGQLHLKQNNGTYFVEDVYCKKIITRGIGPKMVPDSTVANVEHTWPQSHFTHSFPNEVQKSDLHHLFPTDSRANSTRGNFDFADVTANMNLGADCPASKSGPSVIAGGNNYFEPPTDHKGNVARAIFYFSIRYKISIPANEEQYLRRWNEIDPVDQAEMDRNNQIEKIQGNRNPFIDYPQLANDISKF